MPNSKHSVKITLYSVVSNVEGQSLDSLFETLKSTPLKKRNREVSAGNCLRAETLQPPSEQSPYWLVDFVRMREHGPGKVNPVSPIEGFQLEAEDAFGEETAVLYLPKEKFLFLQSNIHGTSISSLRRYFSMIGGGSDEFEIDPALDPSVEGKLLQMDSFSKFTIKVAPALISQSLRRKNASLEQALQISEQTGASYVDITLSVGHSKTRLTSKVVRDMIQFVKKAVSEEQDAIMSAKVTGKSLTDTETQSEILDLLVPKQQWSFDDLKLGNDRRYTQKSRFSALIRAYNGWKSSSR